MWQPIDYSLLQAIQLETDWTDTQSGHYLKYEQSDAVSFLPEKKIRKSEAAIENKTSGKKYKKSPGEYWITTPVMEGGAELPSWSEWLTEMANRTDEDKLQNKWSHLAEDASVRRVPPNRYTKDTLPDSTVK